MIVRSILKDYQKIFGFFIDLKLSWKLSKLNIVITFLFAMSTGLLLYFFDLHTRTLYWFILVIVAMLFLMGSHYLIQRSLKKKHGGPEGLYLDRLKHFDEILVEKLKINNDEKFDRLKELVAQEMDEHRKTFEFPFKKTLQQLFIAVIVTGLLSSSIQFFQKNQLALFGSLFTLYIMIFGIILGAGSVIFILKQFTTSSKMMQFHKTLDEIRLMRQLNYKLNSDQED